MMDKILDAQESNHQKLVITGAGKINLLKASKWAKWISIVGFVLAFLLLGLIIISLIDVIRYSAFDSEIGIILLIAVFFFGLVFWGLGSLVRFSEKIKNAFAFDDQVIFERSLKSLSTSFSLFFFFLMSCIGLVLLVIIASVVPWAQILM